MVASFQFEEDRRTFTCRVEERRSAKGEKWWWFGVSGDGHRYAPFQAASGDTEASVRTRILTYYSDLLARRAAPVVPRPHWANRAKPAVVVQA